VLRGVCVCMCVCVCGVYACVVCCVVCLLCAVCVLAYVCVCARVCVHAARAEQLSSTHPEADRRSERAPVLAHRAAEPSLLVEAVLKGAGWLEAAFKAEPYTVNPLR